MVRGFGERGDRVDECDRLGEGREPDAPVQGESLPGPGHALQRRRDRVVRQEIPASHQAIVNRSTAIRSSAASSISMPSPGPAGTGTKPSTGTSGDGTIASSAASSRAGYSRYSRVLR